MRKKEQQLAVRHCANCSAETNELKLQQCVICRGEFCLDCAVTGYGRDFCSTVCREFFFHGDEDDLGEEE